MRVKPSGLVRDFQHLARIAFQIARAKVLRKRIPVAVSLHVTNSCNLRCKYCYSNKDGRFNQHLHDFSTVELKHYIREMRQLGTRWIVLLGGEPLLRKDIGELIRFVKREGMLCEIVTNGILLPEKIDEVKDVDLICLSLDGNEHENDIMRGTGSYKSAIRGLKVVSRHGLKIRIHAVLSRYNMHRSSLNHLSGLARLYRASFGYSSPILATSITSTRDADPIDRDQLTAFLRIVKEYKKHGHPIYNTLVALDKAIAWPLQPDQISKRGSSCHAGHRFCYVDSEGFVYPCIRTGITNGLNIRDVGFKNAFDHMASHRCGTCAYLQYVESNDIIDLRPNGVLLGITTFLRRLL